MGSESIHPDLIKIALDKAEGYQFEAFVNAFYPGLVGSRFIPLGGVTDGGADAVERAYERDNSPQVFYQASIETDYRGKIKRTVKRLREFGRDPRSLTYVTSRTIKYIDREETSLTDELNVTIRIRDADYIIAHVNDGPTTQSAYRQYLSHLTDFLRSVGAARLVAPSAHVRSPAVYVFLEQELARRSGDTHLVDAVTDSLILWALEGTDPDAHLFMSSADVLERVSREIPATRQVIEGRLERRLNYLCSKQYPGGRQVNWHRKDEVYVLPYETRQRIEDETGLMKLCALMCYRAFTTGCWKLTRRNWKSPT